MILTLLLWVVVVVRGASMLLGTKGFTVKYRKADGGLFGRLGGLFKKEDKADTAVVMGIDRVTAQFGNITAIVGSPGSGKSTLLKGIHTQNRSYGTGPRDTAFRKANGGLFVSAGAPAIRDGGGTYSSVYLNEFFYETYKSTQTVESICDGIMTMESSVGLYQRAVQVMDIPTDTKVESLMESQRRCFEIMLALLRLQSSSVGSGSGSGSGSGASAFGGGSEGSEGPAVLLLLDEYFDKDNPAVVRNVFRQVRELSRTLPFQVLVVTHCKSVADCADWAVCIHKGGLFHQQQTGKLQRPEQHQWREDE